MASRDSDSKKDAMEVGETEEEVSPTSTGAGDVIQDKTQLTDSKHDHMEVVECQDDVTATTTTETDVPGTADHIDGEENPATSEETTQTVGGSPETSEGTTQTLAKQCQGSCTQTELPTSVTATQTAGTTTLTSASATQTSPTKSAGIVQTHGDGTVDTAQTHVDGMADTVQTHGDGVSDTAQTHDGDSNTMGEDVTVTPAVASGNQVDPGGVTTTVDENPSSTKQAEACDVDNSPSNVTPVDSSSDISDTVHVKLVEFKVIYNKQKYDVTFPVNKTVAQLKDHVQTLTGVPSPMQKIMYKGLAKDHCTLEDLKVTKGAKIMVVGSTMNDVLAVNNAPSKKEIEEEAKAASSKEPLCQLKMHKKALDKYGKPDDLMPGIKNKRQPLPPQPVSGMYNKSGGKVRLTFKLELDQVWLGTKERTEKLPMNSIKAVVSEAIDGHEEYHLMALQLGPTEASRYWIYWVPAQYVDAIKDTVLGKWQFF